MPGALHPPPSACCILPLRQRKVRKSSVLGLRRDKSWMEEDSEEAQSDDSAEEEQEGAEEAAAAAAAWAAAWAAASPPFRPPWSATLTGVVLGELGCDWANFLWACSRGLRRRREKTQR